MVKARLGPYVYVYADTASGELLYVGKGDKYRAWRHASSPYINPELSSRILKSRATLHIFLCESHADANRKERMLIFTIGRRDLGTGTLLNRTAGGQGSRGRKNFRHDAETKRRISEKLKGRRFTEEHRKAISESTKGRTPPTAEHFAKMLKARQTPEARARNSERTKRIVPKEQLQRMTERARVVNRERYLARTANISARC